MTLVHSHMRAVCLQSLSSDRELQRGNGKWKPRRPLAAYRALSRQARRSSGREGSLLLDSSAELSSAERDRKRRFADWLSRVKVIDHIECVWPWLVT